MVTGMPGGGANGTESLQERARAALASSLFADVTWVAETASTNLDAMRLARRGAPEGAVVVADHQTAGRGRRGRSWNAPAGASLLFTTLLRPTPEVAGLVTMLLSVAAVEAIDQLLPQIAGVVRIKWPNDLVAGDPCGSERKLAGILAEADWPAGPVAASGSRSNTGASRVAVAAGIGINVNWEAGSVDVPEEVAGVAVALNELAGSRIDRVDLLVAVLQHLEARYGELADRGPPELLRAWRSRSATLGRRVRVDLGAQQLEGAAVDISDGGHLVVETDDGQRREIAAGDVFHLRSAPPP